MFLNGLLVTLAQELVKEWPLVAMGWISTERGAGKRDARFTTEDAESTEKKRVRRLQGFSSVLSAFSVVDLFSATANRHDSARPPRPHPKSM